MPTNHFKEVPDHWKAPVGPYYQAPAEHGGDWWLVNPFTASQPWLYQDKRPEEGVATQGFCAALRPETEMDRLHESSGAGHRAFQVATVQWEQELRYFKGDGKAGVGRRPEKWPRLRLSMWEWNLGRPMFYEGRFGWMGRFIESKIKDYDSSAWQIINYPHHTVSQYQIRLYLDHGIRPEKWHPFVPPSVFLSLGEAQKEIERRLREASQGSKRTVPSG